jgi:hypothetical protein
MTGFERSAKSFVKKTGNYVGSQSSRLSAGDGCSDLPPAIVNDEHRCHNLTARDSSLAILGKLLEILGEITERLGEQLTILSMHSIRKPKSALMSAAS